MKKILLFLCVFTIASYANGKKSDDFPAWYFSVFNIDDFDGKADGKADFMSAALNIMPNFGLDKNGFVGQTTIIDCPGMSKQDIYVQAKIWLEELCANDPQSEIRLDPTAGTTIVVKKYLNNIFSKDFCEMFKGVKKQLKGYNVKLMVNIRIDVKEEKCRLETTIEEYVFSTYISGAYGVFKKELKFPFPPNACFPFVSDNRMKKQQSVAYVVSFFVTQIIHDNMVKRVTSAPSYNDGSDMNDW